MWARQNSEQADRVSLEAAYQPNHYLQLHYSKTVSETNFQLNYLTSLTPSQNHFLFTFPGVIRWPMTSGGVQRNSQRLGKFCGLTFPHLRGLVCHAQFSATCTKRNPWRGSSDTIIETSPLPWGLSGQAHLARRHVLGIVALNARVW